MSDTIKQDIEYDTFEYIASTQGRKGIIVVERKEHAAGDGKIRRCASPQGDLGYLYEIQNIKFLLILRYQEQYAAVSRIHQLDRIDTKWSATDMIGINRQLSRLSVPEQSYQQSNDLKPLIERALKIVNGIHVNEQIIDDREIQVNKALKNTWSLLDSDAKHSQVHYMIRSEDQTYILAGQVKKYYHVSIKQNQGVLLHVLPETARIVDNKSKAPDLSRALIGAVHYRDVNMMNHWIYLSRNLEEAFMLGIDNTLDLHGIQTILRDLVQGKTGEILQFLLEVDYIVPSSSRDIKFGVYHEDTTKFNSIAFEP